MPFKVIFYSHRGYLQRKGYALCGEHIITCKCRGYVIILRRGFHYVETYSTIQKSVFDDMDTNILRECVHLLFIV